MSEKVLQEILSEIKSMNNKINSMESQQKENTQILRALEENSKVHGAKLESLDNRLSHVEGSVKRIEGNIHNIEGDIGEIKDDGKSTTNIANLALNNAAQNRLDIADLKQQQQG